MSHQSQDNKPPSKDLTNLIPAWKLSLFVSAIQPRSPSHHILNLLGVFLWLHFLERWAKVTFSTTSGVWFGTIRMENFPMTCKNPITATIDNTSQTKSRDKESL